MKSIPWSAPNLYNLHSNPEKLYGYGDDLHYLPTATQIYDALDFHAEWWEANEDNGGWDEDYPTTWSLDFFIRQRDDAEWEYENDTDGHKPSLIGLSDSQLEWLHDFIVVRYDDLNIDYNDKKGMVDAFAKFYKNGRIKK